MEKIPSPFIVFKTKLVSTDNSLVSPHSPEHGSLLVNQIDHNEQDDGDGFMSDATANLTMSQSGRLIKPFQKFQDMEWKTVRRKGKQGRQVNKVVEAAYTTFHLPNNFILRLFH